MSLKAPNVLISGFGIAATVYASTLLRAYPRAKITILEREPSMRLTGASVDIRSSAVDIIKWMKHEPAIRAKTTKEEGVEFLDASGKTVATFKATGNTEVQSMTSEYEIFRSDLARIFWEPIKDKVEVIFNETVESYQQHDDCVEVTFSNSKQTKPYDLLVAADGLGSKIRGMMLNTKPNAQIHDEGVYTSFFVIESDMLHGSKVAKWYNTTGGRAILLRPDPDPRGRTRGHFMSSKWSNDIEGRNKLNAALRQGNAAYIKHIEEEFADVQWQCPEILQAMRDSPDLYCSKFAKVRCERIQDGRVVLLGDAAHACPGLGTSLAIIGAHILAGELLRHNGDIKIASKAYEALMLPFANRQQGSVGDNSMQYLNPQSNLGLWIRNTGFWVVTASKIDRIALWVAGLLGFSEEKIKLPEYPWPAEVEA